MWVSHGETRFVMSQSSSDCRTQTTNRSVPRWNLYSVLLLILPSLVEMTGTVNEESLS